MSAHQPGVYPVPSCAECGLESAGRCPSCGRHLCIDHFGLEDHIPCGPRLIQRARTTVCYVCGSPLRPQQWSTSVFAHYIDSCTCAGCRRYICDEQHTQMREERVELVMDGVRSHRYYVTRRYCELCYPLRVVGGLIGAGWVASALSIAAIAALVFIHQL
jgi:hypothetical protein